MSMLLLSVCVIAVIEFAARSFPSIEFKRSTSTSQALQQNIIHYTTACVQPGLNYFNKMFESNLRDTFGI